MVTQKQVREECPELPTLEHVAACLRCQEIARAVTEDVPLALTQAFPASPPRSGGKGSFNELSPGAQVDRYVIQRRLGVGGMGVVYLAFDPELNRNVALKLFNGAPRSLSSSSSNEHLMLEARAMAQLQHPNVVAIYDVGQFEATVFLSMQYVEGRTLRRWAKEKPRTWREWRDVMQEAGKGLAAAHHKGLVHRDFKPDNVLVDQNGHVLVTDFGLARRTEERDPTLEGAGTLGYMAPEQVSGESVDARADIFSFCVTFYEGLFNQKPFEGKTARAYLEQVRNGLDASTPSAEETPSWLVDSIRRGLRADPHQRHSSMAELLEVAPRILALPNRCTVELFRKEMGEDALAAAYARVKQRHPRFDPGVFYDDEAWIDFVPAMELFQVFVELSGDRTLPRRGSRLLTARKTMGAGFNVLKIFGNPMFAYRKLFELAPDYNQVGTFKLIGIARGQMTFSYTSDIPETSDVCCEARKGQFEAIPRIWGLPLARIEESGCQVKGGKSCLYYIQWDEPAGAYGSIALACAIVGLHLGALTLQEMHAVRSGVLKSASGALMMIALAVFGWWHRRHQAIAEESNRLPAGDEQRLPESPQRGPTKALR